jgi:hypothetical protein
MTAAPPNWSAPARPAGARLFSFYLEEPGLENVGLQLHSVRLVAGLVLSVSGGGRSGVGPGAAAV